MQKALVCFLFMIISSIAYSDTREGMIKRLMVAQGIYDIFEQQMQYGKVEGEKQARKILDQFLVDVNPNDEYRKKFSDAYMKYVKSTEGPWTSEEIADTWAKYYGPNFTDSELNSLVEFYESDLGQKEKNSTKKAMIEFYEHYRKLGEPIVQKATQEYIEDLQYIAKNCNCKK